MPIRKPLLVECQGPAAPWKATLRAAGVQLSPNAPLLVVTTGHPPKRQTRPWLWLAPRGLTHEAREAAVRAGAYDVIERDSRAAAERLRARLTEMAVPDPDPPLPEGTIAASPAMQAVLRQVYRVAQTALPVLLTGETGTGKEVVAGLLHLWSARRGPYVPINCAAIPNELMESELFGHVRGAFSGAVATVDGKLLHADGGSAFLDEIDDTPLSIQAKLLRVLEDSRVSRVGETESRRVDFRLVAATNRDLLALVEQNRFGRDFYERLATIRIALPRLGERHEDVGAFVIHFLQRFAERHGRPPLAGVQPAALAALEGYPWPGNIRELRNVIYQALANKRAGDELLLSDVLPLLGHDVASHKTAPSPRAQMAAGRFNLRAAVESLEREALSAALELAGGSPTGAARLLGEVGRGRSRGPEGTVRSMMRRLGIA